jgi:hypothetical protein
MPFAMFCAALAKVKYTRSPHSLQGGNAPSGGDGHIVGICVVVGMHDAVDARGGDLIAGPEGVRTHVLMPFWILLVVPA